MVEGGCAEQRSSCCRVTPQKSDCPAGMLNVGWVAGQGSCTQHSTPWGAPTSLPLDPGGKPGA